MQINRLTLRSKNLEAQYAFYQNTLGLATRHKTSDSFLLVIGDSHITFVQRDSFTPYHFALDIPCNQIMQSTAWLKERTEVLVDNDNTYIHDFDFWSAKAVYFYDADQNIVEFIARRPLENETDLPFSATSLLGISEIGIPVSSIQSIHDQIQAIAQVPVFSGSVDQFCAMGNDEGLFIVIDNTKRKWFPKNDLAHPSPFEVEFRNGEKTYTCEFNGVVFSEKRT